MAVETQIEEGLVKSEDDVTGDESYVAPEIAAAQAGEVVTFTMSPVSGDPEEE